VAGSGSGGIAQRITVNSQNLRRYECNNQTSGIHGTLYETVRNRHELWVYFVKNNFL